MTNVLKAALALTLCVGAGAALAGCSGSGDQTKASSVELPTKNRAQWVLPLDQYMPANWDPEFYAENALAQPCMTKAGYDWNPPAQTIDPPTGESWNAAGRKLFNADLAAKYGYSNSPMTIMPAAEKAADDAFVQEAGSLGQSGGEQLKTCILAARKVTGWKEDPTSYAQDLRLSAQQSDSDRTRVSAAAKKWAACMKPLGIADLPSSPPKMPSDSVAADTSDTPNRAVSDTERSIAVHDAKCRETSGWAAAEYRAEWNAEVPLLEKNADTLQRYLAVSKKQRERALKIIADHPLTQG